MKDADAVRRAHDVFDPLCDKLFARPNVDIGPMFGSEGVRVLGKVFAFVAGRGELVVKLPSDRIDALIDTGIGARMEMRGRVMREWMHVGLDHTVHWESLMTEAHDFVRSITVRPDRRTAEREDHR
ncbi:hypothetical protein [Gordonia sp. (in: high G+C Gram-positive bacteria)]|uniref:hypothetical protein n=1 Tax=Gordonia sp. (in: high G+C Gram-positive bacteria) TaxID=84139 RepID=UPI00333E97B6